MPEASHMAGGAYEWVVGAKSRNVAWGLTLELQGQQTL